MKAEDHAALSGSDGCFVTHQNPRIKCHQHQYVLGLGLKDIVSVFARLLVAGRLPELHRFTFCQCKMVNKQHQYFLGRTLLALLDTFQQLRIYFYCTGYLSDTLVAVFAQDFQAAAKQPEWCMAFRFSHIPIHHTAADANEASINRQTVGYTTAMTPRANVSLRDYSTMRLGGTAAYVADIHDRAELTAALAWAAERALPVMMIGSGSNIVWRDEGFPGLLLVNKIMRYEDFNEDGTNHYLTVGAGENWDSVIDRTVQAGLTGIEALSLIPGTAGATPVQNVGAYGQEIAETLMSVEAYDTAAKQFSNIPAADCAFGYRISRFKTSDRGRFFITAITLHLMHGNPEPPFYPTLEKYFAAHNIETFTPQAVREAVIDIRSHKLPDPAKVANNGSFFANPVVDDGTLAQLLATYSEVPHWQAKGGAKLAAAWLIEQAGFKDYHDKATGMATWPVQPLVLVNESAKTTADLLKFRQRIIDAVQQKFGVTLEQEPELLP